MTGSETLGPLQITSRRTGGSNSQPVSQFWNAAAADGPPSESPLATWATGSSQPELPGKLSFLNLHPRRATGNIPGGCPNRRCMQRAPGKGARETMAIEVLMPDGSTQEFPSMGRLVRSQEIGGTDLIVQQPQYHRDWEFYRDVDAWRARERRR